MVTIAAVALVLVASAGPAAASRKPLRSGQDDLLGREDGPKSRNGAVSAPVPLPRPRPVDAPGAKPETRTKPETAPDNKDEPSEAARPAEPAAPAAPEPSACRRALTEEVAVAPSIPDIHDPGGCGGEDLVRLEAVVLADKRRVALTPAATLRCKMALAVADWVRTDMAPLAASLGSPLSALDNYDSYECRGRNRIVGAQLSEHGRANALDVRGFKLADGRSIGLTDRTVPRELRETVLQSVCARFPTVLGPGSDWYHEEHIRCCRPSGPRKHRRARSPLVPGTANLRPSRKPTRRINQRPRRTRRHRMVPKRTIAPTSPGPSRRRASKSPASRRQQKSAGETGAFNDRGWRSPYCIMAPPPCSAICELNGESPCFGSRTTTMVPTLARL